MHEEFSRFHPSVNFTYFAAVIGLSMATQNPAFLCISLVSAFVYLMMLKGIKTASKSLLFILPLMIFMAILNPVFNHKGVTIITYLPDGNPLTMESIFYGFAAATQVAGIICWFFCLNHIMTSDKLTYLFGRVVPSLALIFSMTLRLVPQFVKQVKETAKAQQTIGNDITKGSLITRLRGSTSIMSAMLTRSLEGAIDTSDSMKARGYGLPGRTSFSVFRWCLRDLWAVISAVILSAYVVTALIFGNVRFNYFPSIEGAEPTPYYLSVCTAFLLLCILPVIIEIREAIKWKYLRRKI